MVGHAKGRYRRARLLAGIIALVCCYLSRPALAAGESQFVLTNDFQLIANWSIEIDSISDSSPAIDQNGTVYFGTWKGTFWAFNTNGYYKWVFNTGSEIKSSPAIAEDGTIYFGSRDRKFYALR